MEYRIVPIPLTCGDRDLSQYTYRLNRGTPCKSAGYIWYIENSSPKTIIDAGDTAGMPGEQILATLDEGLAKAGVRAEEIERVIITHLHIDHISYARRFPNAEFFVQRKEWEYAQKPHPMDRGIYISAAWNGVKFTLLDGDTEIDDGISVIFTPGHTPGGQTVCVKTDRGTVAVSGVCGLKETFEATELAAKFGWEHSIPLIHQDVYQCYDSVSRIKAAADVVVFNHDPAYISCQDVFLAAERGNAP